MTEDELADILARMDTLERQVRSLVDETATPEIDDDPAPPAIRKVHRGAAPDPIRGLFATPIGTAEYWPDADLRDTERVPLLEKGGVDAFLRREAIPYVPDAWYVPASVRVGYEISFNREFFVYQPPRPLDEILDDIEALQQETNELLAGITFRL